MLTFHILRYMDIILMRDVFEKGVIKASKSL